MHASAFFVLLGSGLVLYLPSLSVAVGRRPLLKDIHFWTGISWAVAIFLIAVLGNRGALMRAVREIDVFDSDMNSASSSLSKVSHGNPARSCRACGELGRSSVESPVAVLIRVTVPT